MKAETMCILAAMSLLPLAGCHKHEQAAPAPAVRVETMVVGEGESPTALGQSRVYSGTVEESSGAALSFSVAGTIQSLTVDEGDRVSRGQLLGRVDDATLRNSYEISHAALVQAQDAYNRMKMLHDANALAEVRWVETQQILKQAQSADAIAHKALGDAGLHAPQSGYVSEKYADVGTTVAPGQPVLKVVSIDPIKVSVSMPESQMQQVPIGTAATITVAALDGKTWQGRVTERGVAADPISRSYSVKVELPNPDGQLLPGMICDVQLDAAVDVSADSTATVMVLPTSAVLLDADNQNFVWLSRNGQAEKRIVHVGQMLPQGVAITSGLARGDSVITTGQQKVSTGTRVVSVNK